MLIPSYRNAVTASSIIERTKASFFLDCHGFTIASNTLHRVKHGRSNIR
jgi:hypothetical protein